jgi:hypothetical protein
MFIDPPDDTTPVQLPSPSPASIVIVDDGTGTPIDIRPAGDDDKGYQLYMRRREGAEVDAEPLASLARRCLERRRDFEQETGATDVEVEAFDEAQEALLNRMEHAPAVLLDDIIKKLEVIKEEIWDRVAGDEGQLEPADRLVLTLADDFRRVLGATTAYRFDPSLWVESAIRAGMDPSAMIYLSPEEQRRGRTGRWETQRRLFWKVAGVIAAYEPPPLSGDEWAAVIEELVRRGRADYYSPPTTAKPEAIAAE